LSFQTINLLSWGIRKKKNLGRIRESALKNVCWQIWIARNRLVFDDKKADAQQTAFKAANLLKETLNTKQILISPSKKLAAEDLDWCKDLLPQNSLQTKDKVALHIWEIRRNTKEFNQWKANLNSYSLFFDGAAKGNLGEAGTGGVILDPGGVIKTTYACVLGRKTNNEAKWLALYLGMYLGKQLGIVKITVIRDSKQVIQKMNSKSNTVMINSKRIFKRIQHLSRGIQAC